MNSGRLEYTGFVRLVLEALEAAGVEYMIGGAVAAWAWGEPRATMDLDVVVDIPLEAVGKLSKELEKREMLLPAEIILDNIFEDRADIPINVIHPHSGLKADLYPVREQDELRRSAFLRRIKVDLGPRLGEVYLHAPEDLILYKLIYFNLSRQTKHTRDITAIVLTMGDDLDYELIELWAQRKGCITLWRELLVRIRSQSQK